MLGINYESSDEEEIAPVKVAELLNPPKTNAPAPDPVLPPVQNSSTPAVPVNRPSQGPSVPSQVEEAGSTDDAPPGSPYTSTRTTIHNLTLPTMPNWEIPPSPPGSPPLKATKKFTQFLELKKKGQHFNSRLETSSVLRDPNHLRKLQTFAGIDENDQYLSTLPDGLGVPAVWPAWAYGEELNSSQKKLKASEPRGPISFVPPRSGGSSSKSTPSTKDTRIPQSTAKRKELEYRGGREEGSSSSRPRSRSRSPKRRRSWSREMRR